MTDEEINKKVNDELFTTRLSDDLIRTAIKFLEWAAKDVDHVIVDSADLEGKGPNPETNDGTYGYHVGDVIRILKARLGPE